jgi:hypothetical protein
MCLITQVFFIIIIGFDNYQCAFVLIVSFSDMSAIVFIFKLIDFDFIID